MKNESSSIGWVVVLVGLVMVGMFVYAIAWPAIQQVLAALQF